MESELVKCHQKRRRLLLVRRGNPPASGDKSVDRVIGSSRQTAASSKAEVVDVKGSSLDGALADTSNYESTVENKEMSANETTIGRISADGRGSVEASAEPRSSLSMATAVLTGAEARKNVIASLQQRLRSVSGSNGPPRLTTSRASAGRLSERISAAAMGDYVYEYEFDDPDEVRSSSLN